MSNVARGATLAACGLLVASVLVATGLAWRLSRGPIVLDWLTPRFESALSAPDGSVRVAVGSTAIEWDPVDRDVDLRMHDLRVFGAGGAPIATVPDADVAIAPGALLRGQVVPGSIEAIAPHIQLVRQPDGRVAIGLGGEPAAETTRVLGGPLQQGAAGARAERPVLRSIGVRDGEMTIDDRATGTIWHATRVSLAAHREPGVVVIDRLAFEIAPGRVVATGRVAGGVASLQADVSHLPTSVIERWWPAGVAPAARRWVEANVSGGGVGSAHVNVAGAVAGDRDPTFALGAWNGRFQFAGLDVRWLEGMPPMTGVAGVGIFSRDGWELRIARGDVEGLELVRAVVGPKRDATGIQIDTTARGPLSKAFALLARPPLRSVGGLPFRPGEISGGVTGRVLVDVPERGAVAVRANGDLRSVSMRRAFRGRNVTAQRLRVDLDERRFEMRGQVAVGHAVLQLRWRETPSGIGPAGKRVIDLKGQLDDAGRKALGIDLAPWLDGPVDVHARLEPKGPDATAMNLQIDLSPATLDLPLLNMVKGPGDPGSAQASLLLANSEVRAADAFQLEANGSTLTARASFGPDETWRTAEGKASIAPRVEGGATGTVSFQMRPAGVGSELTATSDDAGAVLRAIDSYADASGGRLQLTSEIRPGVPGVPMSGKLRIDKFTLTRSPMIAKVAALTSISGIVDALAAGGIPMSQLGVDFTQRSGVVTLSDCLATGPAMAFTLHGTVDRTRDDLALDGALVPNYPGLARLAASAAMVGPTPPSTPGEASRIEAAEFAVSGSLADPYVTARPATATETRALRGLPRAPGSRWSTKAPDELETTQETKGKRSRRKLELAPAHEARRRPRRRVREAPSEPGTGIE